MSGYESFDVSAPAPEVGDVALMLGTVVRADGKAIDAGEVVREYGDALASLVGRLRAGRTPEPGERFFVPDLWKVAKAGGRRVPAEEGERLYQAQVYGHRLGEAFMERDYSDVNGGDRSGFPGAAFVAK